MVNPAGRVVILFGEGEGRIPFIVAQVQIRFRAVVRHVDFPVLIRIHRAGIDVDVGIELEERDLQPSTLEQVADRGRGKPFPKEETTPPVTKMNLLIVAPILPDRVILTRMAPLPGRGCLQRARTPAR